MTTKETWKKFIYLRTIKQLFRKKEGVLNEGEKNFLGAY